MRRLIKPRRQRGQAMVESAIVFPTMLFSEEQETLLAVLSQKTPREILLCLMENASMTQGDLAKLMAFAFNSGDAMMLVAVVFYAGYTVALRERPPVSGLSLLAGMALAAFVTSVPLMIWEIVSGGFVWPTWAGLIVMAYVALGPAFASQMFFMRGVELIGPGRAGVFVNLVPVFGAIMAVVLLGEPFEAYHVVALVLVVGGIAVAQMGARASSRR